MKTSVAIIGAGPSGIYVAKNILKLKKEIHLDFFERLKVPFGLLRFGVAPDHPEVKETSMHSLKDVFCQSNVRLYTAVDVGNMIQITELSKYYDAVVLCTGMGSSRRLFSSLTRPFVYGADQIFGWYNGHPDFRALHFPLKHFRKGLVIGIGNVALDVSRILLKDPELLSETNISKSALEILRSSSLEEIAILGRRSLFDASFTPKELREFNSLQARISTNASFHSCDVPSDANRLSLKNAKILQELIQNSRNRNLENSTKSCEFLFNSQITDLKGPQGRILGNIFGKEATFDADFIVECVGFRQRNTIFPGKQEQGSGRFLSENHCIEDNIFTCGWAHTGPKGTLVDSMVDAERCTLEIVKSGVLDSKRVASNDIESVLRSKGIDFSRASKIDDIQ